MSEVDDALTAWEAAPMHVRMVAGPYVGSLLAALVAVATRVEMIEREMLKNGQS